MTGATPLILNVDDTESVRYVKTRTLRHAGFDVVEAANGRDALRLVEQKDPALVLLDVRLPDMSGLDVCKIVRARHPFTLILQVSASFTSSDDRVQGLDSGADAYLAQPIEPAELIAVVRALLRIRTAEQNLRQLNETLEARVVERTRQLVDSNRRLTNEIAEREKAEASLLQAQKTEALGQLTGGIAHDFNNLLMVILSNLNLMRKRLAPDDAVRRYLDAALQGAERGVVLTQRLLAFSRKQNLEAHAVELPALIDNLSELIAQSAGPLVKVDYDIDREVPPAHIDPNPLELAILNLCVNARDAMGDGGQLSISLRAENSPGSATLTAGEYLVLRIADTGPGMDAATLRRAIEPFFTTKEIGKGTGLGLAMVHGFLLQSGGALILKSEPGRGTQAELWMPASEEELPVRNEEDKVISQARSLKVLVVDDEALLLMSTADTLRDLGHEPYEAMSGEQALGLLEAHPEIDLLITDHAMPRMTGIELAQRAKQVKPDLQVVIASGYARLPEETGLELERLAKPYHEQDLVAVIERLFAEAGAPGR